MPSIPALSSWGPTGVITSTAVTNNFSTVRTYVNAYCGFIDTTNTWASLQTFSVGLTVTASGLTVSAGGVTITGNSTITGTLGSITTLTATTGVFTTLSGAVNHSGTPTFGAGLTVTSGLSSVQALTSAGLLTAGASLSVSGTTTTDIITSNSGTALALRAAGANTITLSTNGTIAWVVTSIGDLKAQTDNTYDIGASGANRPKNIYAAGTITSGGALTVTGNSTITGTLGGVTSLTMSGALSGVTTLGMGGALTGVTTAALSDNLTFTGTTTKVFMPASGTFSFRNSADTANVLSYSVAGAVIQVGSSLMDAQCGAGALATGAIAGVGHTIISSCAGTPTGNASNGSIIIDTSGNKIWCRIGGAWKGVVVA